MSLPDAEALYVALIGDPARRRGLRRLTYWCDRAADRCLLLDAIALEQLGTVLLHQKRFRNSDAVNQRRSNAAGRLRNTFDGDNHWKPRTYYIEQSALHHPDDRSAQQSLQCAHYGVLADGGDLTIKASNFRDDWESGHTEVRVRADGTRFPVH